MVGLKMITKEKIKDRINKLEEESTNLQNKLKSISKTMKIENANQCMILKDQIMFLKGAITSLKDLLNE